MITNEEGKTISIKMRAENINKLEFQGHIKGPSILVDFEVFTMKVMLD